MFITDGIGIWAERLGHQDYAGRPALFLDRDGVIVEEVHFLSNVENLRLMPDVARMIARVNAMGLPVVLVTNQSGIARGYFDWAAFAAVQTALMEQLAAAEAQIDAVFACGYHSSGIGPLGVFDHPWRKPASGMLNAAAEMLSMSLPKSWIIGDRVSDLEAGFGAGLAGGTLVMTGYGSEQNRILSKVQPQWRHGGYESRVSENPAAAVAEFADRMAGEGFG